MQFRLEKAEQAAANAILERDERQAKIDELHNRIKTSKIEGDAQLQTALLAEQQLHTQTRVTLQSAESDVSKKDKSISRLREELRLANLQSQEDITTIESKDTAILDLTRNLDEKQRDILHLEQSVVPHWRNQVENLENRIKSVEADHSRQLNESSYAAESSDKRISELEFALGGVRAKLDSQVQSTQKAETTSSELNESLAKVTREKKVADGHVRSAGITFDIMRDRLITALGHQIEVDSNLLQPLGELIHIRTQQPDNAGALVSDADDTSRQLRTQIATLQEEASKATLAYQRLDSEKQFLQGEHNACPKDLQQECDRSKTLDDQLRSATDDLKRMERSKESYADQFKRLEATHDKLKSTLRDTEAECERLGREIQELTDDVSQREAFAEQELNRADGLENEKMRWARQLGAKDTEIGQLRNTITANSTALNDARAKIRSQTQQISLLQEGDEAATKAAAEVAEQHSSTTTKLKFALAEVQRVQGLYDDLYQKHDALIRSSADEARVAENALSNAQTSTTNANNESFELKKQVNDVKLEKSKMETTIDKLKNEKQQLKALEVELRARIQASTGDETALQATLSQLGGEKDLLQQRLNLAEASLLTKSSELDNSQRYLTDAVNRYRELLVPFIGRVEERISPEVSMLRHEVPMGDLISINDISEPSSVDWDLSVSPGVSILALPTQTFERRTDNFQYLLLIAPGSKMCSAMLEVIMQQIATQGCSQTGIRKLIESVLVSLDYVHDRSIARSTMEARTIGTILKAAVKMGVHYQLDADMLQKWTRGLPLAYNEHVLLACYALWFLGYMKHDITQAPSMLDVMYNARTMPCIDEVLSDDPGKIPRRLFGSGKQWYLIDRNCNYIFSLGISDLKYDRPSRTISFNGRRRSPLSFDSRPSEFCIGFERAASTFMWDYLKPLIT